MLKELLAYAESCVGDIYVWGAEGQENPSLDWIRQSETSESRANTAIALYERRKAEGRDPVKAFDCSGFVSWLMMQIGLMTGHRDCDHLWELCDPIDAVKDGALLFRVDKNDTEDDTHVGIYLGGYQYHSKGRADGVVKEPYDPDYWAKCGWFRTMVADTDADTIETAPGNVEVSYVEKIYFTHEMRQRDVCPDVSKLKSLLVRFGYSGVHVGNNSYGPITRAVVLDYQRSNGLNPTGIADEATITALGGTFIK